MAHYEKSCRVNLRRHFPHMQLYRQDREDVLTMIGLNLTSPEVQVNDLGVMEGRPTAEDAGQFLAALNQRLDV